MAICDRCSKQKVTKENGYLFYSFAEFQGFVFGNLLMCGNCVDHVITDKNFREMQDQTPGLMSSQVDLADTIEFIKINNDISIIKQCISLNLSPVEAKQKAKNLANAFFENPEATKPRVEKEWALPAKSAQSDESNCFIATECYNSPDCRQVRVLRKFRDEILLSTILGSMFIKYYYLYSPKIARYIRKKPKFKKLLRTYVLDLLVKLIQLKKV